MRWRHATCWHVIIEDEHRAALRGRMSAFRCVRSVGILAQALYHSYHVYHCLRSTGGQR